MSRVVAYIDGFNLYFGLRVLGDKSLYWLDLPALCRALLKPGQELLHTHYFTARIHADGRGGREDKARQDTYLDALSAQPNLSVHLGHFLSKSAGCRSCGASWTTYEEKQSDVNLAVELLCDAFDDRFDTALVLSADSDLSTPIRRVQALNPLRRVVVAFPPGRNSEELRRSASASFPIGVSKLRRSQLPDTVPSRTGYPLRRPPSWA